MGIIRRRMRRHPLARDSGQSQGDGRLKESFPPWFRYDAPSGSITTGLPDPTHSRVLIVVIPVARVLVSLVFGHVDVLNEALERLMRSRHVQMVSFLCNNKCSKGRRAITLLPTSSRLQCVGKDCLARNQSASSGTRAGGPLDRQRHRAIGIGTVCAN